MFTKEIQAQISAYFGVFGNQSIRAVNMTRGLILIIQVILQSLDIIKSLWDNTFGPKNINVLESNYDIEPLSGFTKRWWKTAQAAFVIYFVTMDLPLEAFYNLSLTDNNGNTIYPYRLFNPTEIIPGLTIKKFAWTEPETLNDVKDLIEQTTIIEPIIEPILEPILEPEQ